MSDKQNRQTSKQNYLPLKSRIENFFDSHSEPQSLIVLEEMKIKYWIHPTDAKYYAIVIESKYPVQNMTDLQYNDMCTIRKHLEYRYGKANVYLERTQSDYLRIYFFEDFERDVSRRSTL